MSYEIIGNSEYKSIKEKTYINGTQDNIMRLAQELDKAGINYSGRISEYRSAITVEAADRGKSIEIMNGIIRRNDNRSNINAENNIIGNVEYRYIANKRYIKGETEAMLRTADRLTAEKISFSGKINGNMVTLTVSGDEMQERVKKYFSEEINRGQNVQSVYLLSVASDGYEDGYYISEVNANTGEEISPYRSNYGDIPMFVSVDEAMSYTQNTGIELSNTESQFAEWRKAEEEKERQMLLEKSREIIRQLPMTGQDYEEQFIFRDDAVDWIYFNPDGNDGEGEFVETTIYAADIINAYKERTASENAENGRNSFLETIIHSCEQRIIEAGTADFESYAQHFIADRDKNNVLKTFGIYENSNFTQNVDTVINKLENHFEEVRSYTENIAEQLYELAKKELEDFENSLDTIEKAKAAAYELSVKRDILSYIQSDLSNDITDSDTEEACRRLISSGYPLDTFYQDWLKNEYDNRMEAVKMTAADSLKRETQHFEKIENAKNAAHNAGLPFRNAPNEEPTEDFDPYSADGSMSIEDYELMHKLMKEDQSEDKTLVDKDKNNTLIVNIYGGPGAGKSTTALQLAAELKKRGFHAEYISEVAKEYVYAKNFDILDGSLSHQKQIFSEQKHRQDLMIGNVDVAITDAPLPLNTIYINSDEKSLEYSNYIMGEYSKYNNYNIYIDRDLSVEFENEGRIHNLSESIEKDGEIKSMLIDNKVTFDEFDRNNISEITDKIVENLPFDLKQKAKEITEKHNSSYAIYQIPSGERYSDIRFASYSDLDKMGQLPDSLNYKKVYSGNLDDIKYDNKLEGIFVQFNMNHPEDFEGHSLSVSDVVVIENEDDKKAYFVDDIGYKDISDIFLNLNRTEQQKENSPVENQENFTNVTITCNYSESSAFEDGKTYSVAEFDRIMAEADAERVNGWKNGLKKYGNEDVWRYNDSESYYKYIGYDKTRFTINFPNGETVSERQDIGDGYGGVIDYCKTFSSLQQYIPLLEAQRELDNTIRERDEHTAVHQELEKDRLEMERERAAEKEKIIDDNEIQSEQLSFFSASPSRRSIDEALSELSDTPEELPASQDDSLLTFSEQVDKVLNGTANRYNDLKVCDTPQILLDVGCEQLPMLYTQQHLRKAIQPKNLTEHTHGLDIDQIKNLPSDIANPVMILDSTSRNDSILLVLSQIDKENCPLLVSVKPNGNGKYNLEVVDSNFITSVYGRENFASFIERNIELNNILFYNKEKSQELFRVLRLQFPQGVNNLDSNTIIHKSRNIVKRTEETQNDKFEKNIDYKITDRNYDIEGGAKTRFTNNVAAIRLLKTIEGENRTATPEEQSILAKYVGWGGIANAFDSRKADWSKEYNELKSLLTDEEYRAARASTMNAHYTSPTVISAIYDGLKNLGFEGGKILEPAMGTGNFFGAMPENIHNNSDLYGVELDSITGRIAKQLYPSANILITGYEQTNFENNSFDVAVGNVPFGGYKVNDGDYNKHNFFIHDYFFAKTLDKVRPGGIVAFVTSQGTLDKSNPEVRKYLAERAELLGAIRLPNNAFKANAGTEVTSDIIFLQKRERPISIEENTPDWVYKDMLPNGIAVNKYFAEHPEMILGEMVEGNKMYGNQSDASMCVPIEGADLTEQLKTAIKNITGTYQKAEKTNDKTAVLNNSEEIPCPPNTLKYSFIVMDDVLYYHKSADTMEKVSAPEKNIEKIKAMVQLRDSIHKLLDLQLENTNGRFDNAILEAQETLNKQYDDFSEKYGLISNSENKMLFRNDNSYHLIKSLEKLDKDGNFIGKADIFSKITVNPKTIVDHCDNAQDALILSLSEKMCVNFEYMSQLTDKSEEELIEELGDKIFQNPQKYMRWESADEYLTGNIRSKLSAAESAGLTRNAEALRSVMPKRIEAADISVKLSSAWVDPEYIKQFIVETLKPDFITSKNIEVTYMPATDKWKIEGWRSAYSNTLANETYGTHDISAYEIIEATLNMQKVEIRERVKDENGNYLRDKNGRYIYELNQQKTMIAQSKQDDLKRKFSEWIFADPDRREKLVDVYNEKFNSVRLREYDGSHLNFVGMNSSITLKEHQKNAVARGLYSNGNTLLAHEVGAGKTYEMIAIAMEGKRLGLHNKPLITAPNGLTEQWGNAFRQLYPNANVLVATEKDFQKENRRDLFAKIATGDWDAVIIGHSQFDMIHLSRERELDMLNSELDHLESALSEMMDDSGKRSFSVKQIEKAIKSYQDKIEKLLDKTPEDDMLCFEKLGIDKLFVDESQAYKNLDTPTKMRNVSGIGSGGSGRAMQLLMKCKYLDELTGEKGCVFASGTPISNSMSEMYTLMRYLQADKLEEMEINSFDRWASVFGETVSSMELSPEGNGKYQMKTRFAKFQNLPELMNIFKECADIKTADTLNLDRPDYEMHNINVPATAIQASMIKELGKRAKEIRAGNVDPTEDNMCKLTVDGRKIGLDQRCINPNLPDDPKSKVNVCINNVFDIWQRTSAEKSTQLIFCDLATPQPTLNENTYMVYRPNTNSEYSKVYTAKLNDKDTAEKIMKKLNSNKPPKNYDAGEIANGDIIMLKRINYGEETAYYTAFEAVDGKLNEISPETWDKLHHTPTEHFASERKYCVYDDIKQKLVAKGVPEKEIAFIHDVDKAEDKQALYDKMNKGEIRVLIGSTFKCGAGMNAQERMIALHDLDAPMRPSDMEQRHGRIIRQGNTNSKVDIFRYTTDKTFDAYLYQMLENKQKFISQIMTDKSPVRSCEDVDEVALDYAEVKALCAGNPLIKEKIDLETEITKLNVIKSAFLSQKYSLQDKAYKTLPEKKSITEHYIERLKADIERVQSVKPLANEEGKKYYPITVNGKEYHNKEDAGNAIRQAVINNSGIMENKECTIGSYRGFEMKAFIDTHFEMSAVKVNLKGACDHYGDINMDNNVKASGNIIRLDNIINGIELELQKQEDRLQSLNADIKEAKAAAEAEFPQEHELTEKEKRLAQVNSLLTNSDIQTDNSTELYAALTEICPELEQYNEFNCKYEKSADSDIEPLIVEKYGDTVFIAHTYVQNGDLMYDPAIEFSFDTQNHTAQALSYQLSGMGIYEDFRDGNSPDMKEDVERMALDTMFENIRSSGYERTMFNADNSRETEKENCYDFAR